MPVTVQFKMRVREDFVTALETAARNHNRRSAQQVAEEVIETYLSFWEQAEQVKQNKVEEQRKGLAAEAMIWARKAKPLQKKKGDTRKTKQK